MSLARILSKTTLFVLASLIILITLMFLAFGQDNVEAQENANPGPVHSTTDPRCAVEDPVDSTSRIAVSGLVKCMDSPSSDSFSVTTHDLDDTRDYLVEVHVDAALNGLLGFDSSCSSGTTNYDPEGAVPELAFHSCQPAVGVVYAVLKEDGEEIARTGAHIVVALAAGATGQTGHVPQPKVDFSTPTHSAAFFSPSKSSIS